MRKYLWILGLVAIGAVSGCGQNHSESKPLSDVEALKAALLANDALKDGDEYGIREKEGGDTGVSSTKKFSFDRGSDRFVVSYEHHDRYVDGDLLEEIKLTAEASFSWGSFLDGDFSGAFSYTYGGDIQNIRYEFFPALGACPIILEDISEFKTVENTSTFDEMMYAKQTYGLLQEALEYAESSLGWLVKDRKLQLWGGMGGPTTSGMSHFDSSGSSSSSSSSKSSSSSSSHSSSSSSSHSGSYTWSPSSSGVRNYYKNVDFTKTGSALKTSFFNTVKSHSELSYSQLWTAFKTTDKRSDGKVWDMYSSSTNYAFGTGQCGSYSGEGDCYNREHSVPKSWFGNAEPMYTDLFHLVPTDGYVNQQRSNYPFGEVSTPTYTSNNRFSKLGYGSGSYSGIVFEPNDEYKGDFARIYFYFVTAYEDKVASFSSSGTNFGGTKYPGLNSWTLKMFLRWAQEDPVSKKEVDRNNAVYGIQGNRNPYVDFPEAAEAVFGS